MEYRCLIVGDPVTEPGALMRRLLYMPIPRSQESRLRSQTLRALRYDEAHSRRLETIVSPPPLNSSKECTLVMSNPSMPSVDVRLRFDVLTSPEELESYGQSTPASASSSQLPESGRTSSAASSRMRSATNPVRTSTVDARIAAQCKQPHAIVVLFNPFSMKSYTKVKLVWAHYLARWGTLLDNRAAAAGHDTGSTTGVHSSATGFAPAAASAPADFAEDRSFSFASAAAAATDTHGLVTSASPDMPTLLLAATRMELSRQAVEATPTVASTTPHQIADLAARLDAKAYVELGTDWEEEINELRLAIARACVGELRDAATADLSTIYVVRQASMGKTMEDIQHFPDEVISEPPSEAESAFHNNNSNNDINPNDTAGYQDTLRTTTSSHTEHEALGQQTDDDEMRKSLPQFSAVSGLQGSEDRWDGDDAVAGVNPLCNDSESPPPSTLKRTAQSSTGDQLPPLPEQDRSVARPATAVAVPTALSPSSLVFDSRESSSLPEGSVDVDAEPSDTSPPDPKDGSSAAAPKKSKWTWRRQATTGRIFFVNRQTRVSQYERPDDYDGREPPAHLARRSSKVTAARRLNNNMAMSARSLDVRQTSRDDLDGDDRSFRSAASAPAWASSSVGALSADDGAMNLPPSHQFPDRRRRHHSQSLQPQPQSTTSKTPELHTDQIAAQLSRYNLGEESTDQLSAQLTKLQTHYAELRSLHESLHSRRQQVMTLRATIQQQEKEFISDCVARDAELESERTQLVAGIERLTVTPGEVGEEDRALYEQTASLFHLNPTNGADAASASAASAQSATDGREDLKTGKAQSLIVFTNTDACRAEDTFHEFGEALRDARGQLERERQLTTMEERRQRELAQQLRQREASKSQLMKTVSVLECDAVRVSSELATVRHELAERKREVGTLRRRQRDARRTSSTEKRLQQEFEKGTVAENVALLQSLRTRCAEERRLLAGECEDTKCSNLDSSDGEASAVKLEREMEKVSKKTAKVLLQCVLLQHTLGRSAERMDEAQVLITRTRRKQEELLQGHLKEIQEGRLEYIRRCYHPHYASEIGVSRADVEQLWREAVNQLTAWRSNETQQVIPDMHFSRELQHEILEATKGFETAAESSGSSAEKDSWLARFLNELSDKVAAQALPEPLPRTLSTKELVASVETKEDSPHTSASEDISTVSNELRSLVQRHLDQITLKNSLKLPSPVVDLIKELGARASLA